MKGRTEWTSKKRETFCKTLIETGGNVSAACQAVGLARSTAYKHKADNEQFALNWQEAIERGTDELEQEARRRAYKGVDEPVFYQGAECGYVRKYSDTLMIFLLKGNRPSKYKERTEITGKDGGPVESVSMSLDEWNKQAAKRLKDVDGALKSFE